jgi:hypothetical protein
MSDADPNEPVQEDQEPEDPRTTIKPETVVEGLSNIQRTAGKFTSSQTFANRRSILRLQHTDA